MMSIYLWLEGSAYPTFTQLHLFELYLRGISQLVPRPLDVDAAIKNKYIVHPHPAAVLSNVKCCKVNTAPSRQAPLRRQGKVRKNVKFFFLSSPQLHSKNSAPLQSQNLKRREKEDLTTQTQYVTKQSTLRGEQPKNECEGKETHKGEKQRGVKAHAQLLVVRQEAL